MTLVLTLLEGDFLVSEGRARGNERVFIIKVLVTLIFIMNLKRFQMMLNLNKVTDPLMGPILIHEHLKDSKLVQGWVKLPGTKLCWHVWVEGNQSRATGIIDIHTFTMEVQPEYVYETGGEEFDSDRQIVDTWDQYQNNPKEYWKTKPMGIRSKLLSSLKQC